MTRRAAFALVSVLILSAAPSCLPAPVAAPATPAPTPTTGGDGQGPGLAWGTFTRNACEWSGTGSEPGDCFGTRGEGFRVRLVRLDGERWLIWDPSTGGVSYVDRDALQVPPDLYGSAGEQPARTVLVCLDRSRGYRDTLPRALSGLADWIQSSAQPGDVYYLRWVQDDSYASADAEMMSPIRVPTVPAPMTAADLLPPAGPTEEQGVNPFSRSQRAEATATAQAEQVAATATVAAVQTTVANQDAARADAQRKERTYVDNRVTELRGLRLSLSNTGDVAGCVRKGSEVLGTPTGERLLIVSADLDPAPT